jgi:hypothetical protein
MLAAGKAGLASQGLGSRSVSAASHGFAKLSNSDTTTPVSGAQDPWSLLPKGENVGLKRGLRLIVHGQAGGVVPACLRSLALQVEHCRGTSVQLEALTADQSLEAGHDPLWLVPLLLLPGSHTRNDLPLIRKRLQGQGGNIKALPFLGAWPSWLSLVKEWMERHDDQKACQVLVHHPLRKGLADRYLMALQQRLAVPIMSWEHWNAYASLVTRSSQPSPVPFPFALAPNKMTETLREFGGASSLLENEVFRLGLINLLAALP